LAVTGIVLLLAGCGFAAPPLRTYVLGDPALPTPGVLSETNLPIIELRTVAVPDYLDSSDILRRIGPNEVTASPTGRWGERLSVGLTQALATALSRRMPDAVIDTTPTAEPTRRLFVDIERFDIGLDGQCLLVAHWRVLPADSHTALASEQATFRETAVPADDAAIALAMTRAVDHLAEQIVLTMPPAPARRTN
jgi:uncharacterized lipoprotein YmbA